MIVGALKRIISSEDGDSHSMDSWEATRSLTRFSKSNAANNAVQSVVVPKDLSWISMACFIEGIEPASLALAPSTLENVHREVAALRGLPALEVYAECLERLSQSDEGDEEDSLEGEESTEEVESSLEEVEGDLC